MRWNCCRRDYDPATGRYVEVDPILQPSRNIVEGEVVFAVPYLLKKIRLLLPYAYVADQPTAGSDPSGLVWPIDLIKCMYYSNKFLTAVQDCKGRCGTTTEQQLHFMAAYGSSSLEDSIFKCGCQNAGGKVCLNMFKSCGDTANGAPKMAE